MRGRVALFAGILVVAVSSYGRAENWPAWRGPNGTSLVTEKNLPSEWSLDKNIKWKIELPGVGWSCPVVWGDRLFVTTAVADNQTKPRPQTGGRGPGGFKGGDKGGDRPSFDKGDKDRGEKKGEYQPPEKGKGKGAFRAPEPPNKVFHWEVYCLDRHTGKQIWKQLAIERKPTIPTHSTNTYASETPIVDGERLYVYFGMTGLFCYDLDGKLLWKKDLGSYPMMIGWGTGSSPLLVGDRLYIQCDNESKSFLVALDNKTGDEIWRDSRDEKSTWSTPYLWKNKERTELVTSGSQQIRSYDPATGKILWELTGSSSQTQSEDTGMRRQGRGLCAASPVGDQDRIYVGYGGGAGSNGPLFAIRAGAKGDISLKENQKSNDFVVWSSNRAGPPMASPLLYQGCLYVLPQRGNTMSCYDAASGKQLYQERIDGATGFTSSPWAYDGKVFCLDQEGQTFVLQAGKEFKVLAKNPLKEMFWSSPAFAEGAIYLRGVDHLFCVTN